MSSVYTWDIRLFNGNFVFTTHRPSISARPLEDSPMLRIEKRQARCKRYARIGAAIY